MTPNLIEIKGEMCYAPLNVHRDQLSTSFGLCAAMAKKHGQNARPEGDLTQKRQVLPVRGHSRKNMCCPDWEFCVCVCGGGWFLLLKNIP